ncbi:MAG: HD-GYP domain-containing protein [Planctomycetota bacterium]
MCATHQRNSSVVPPERQLPPALAAESRNYLPIRLEMVQPGTAAPFDLYRHDGASGLYVLHKAANRLLSVEARNRLVQNGVTELYMQREDEDKFFQWAHDSIQSLIREGPLEVDETWSLVHETTVRAIRRVFDSPTSGDQIRNAQRMAAAVVKMALRDEDPLKHLADLLAYDHRTYTHSVDACVMTVAACKDVLGITGTVTLREVATGALFHDIGMTQLPANICAAPEQLSGEERDLYERHPVLGLEIVQGEIELGNVATSLIRHHSERQEGGGYPDGVPTRELPEAVRLMAIIDLYDKLTTLGREGAALDPFTALDRMIRDMPGRFDMALLREFVRYLGPDSPGSRKPEVDQSSTKVAQASA